jgi:hypothetical protein
MKLRSPHSVRKDAARKSYRSMIQHAPIRNVRLDHCPFDNIALANVVENVERLVLNEVSISGKRV